MSWLKNRLRKFLGIDRELYSMMGQINISNREVEQEIFDMSTELSSIEENFRSLNSEIEHLESEVRHLKDQTELKIDKNKFVEEIINLAKETEKNNKLKITTGTISTEKISHKNLKK